MCNENWVFIIDSILQTFVKHSQDISFLNIGKFSTRIRLIADFEHVLSHWCYLQEEHWYWKFH